VRLCLLGGQMGMQLRERFHGASLVFVVLIESARYQTWIRRRKRLGLTNPEAALRKS
jgi:hypothetical protein